MDDIHNYVSQNKMAVLVLVLCTTHYDCIYKIARVREGSIYAILYCNTNGLVQQTTKSIQFDLCTTKSLNYPHYDAIFPIMTSNFVIAHGAESEA